MTTPYLRSCRPQRNAVSKVYALVEQQLQYVGSSHEKELNVQAKLCHVHSVYLIYAVSDNATTATDAVSRHSQHNDIE